MFWLTDPQMTDWRLRKQILLQGKKAACGNFKEALHQLHMSKSIYESQGEILWDTEPTRRETKVERILAWRSVCLVSVKTTTEVCNGIFNCRTTKRKTKAINWSLKNSLNILYEVADFHPI